MGNESGHNRFVDGLEPAQCNMCRWFRPLAVGESKCPAFPGGIPREIIFNDVDHRLPYEGDHGIRWEPRNESAARAIKILLGEVPGVETQRRAEITQMVEKWMNGPLEE